MPIKKKNHPNNTEKNGQDLWADNSQINTKGQVTYEKLFNHIYAQALDA